VVGQGVAFAIAGAAAEVVPPSTVVALSGGIRADENGVDIEIRSVHCYAREETDVRNAIWV